MSRNMLISLHIPKCAGTSFRFVLQEIYGEKLWKNYGAIFYRAQAQPGIVPGGTACIHGHFQADAFDDLFPRRRLITWLRDPVDRLISAYHYFLRIPDWNNESCRLLHERRLTLVEFAAIPWMRNEATRFFAGKRLADFAFVGLSERIDESMELAAAVLDWPLPLAFPRFNFNPEHTEAHYPISTAEREAIAALNAEDIALYAAAVERFDREVARRRGTVPRDALVAGAVA